MQSKLVLAISVLALSVLACGKQIVTTPTTTPAPAVIAPTVTVTPTPIPSPTATLSPDMAQIIAPTVIVRQTPDGAVIGTLKAGDAVTVLSCADDWCEIAEPAGYVFPGCLSVESGFGCVAR